MYSAALGARVVDIGGVKTEQFLNDLAPYISHENETELREQAPHLMIARGVLEHFHMVSTDAQVSLHLEKQDGKPLNLTVPLVIRNVEKIDVSEGLRIPVPLYRSHSQHEYYWHQYLPETQTLYIQYNTCEDDPKKRFSDFARAVFAVADAQTVKRVVIDLRNNGGGNERVILPLKDGLLERRKSVGRVYVLIGPGTFSSAVVNAQQLRSSLSVILVGENTGGMLGGYGEASTVTLPNSKLVVQFTTKRWDTTGPKTLVPNILAPLTIADFLAGRDPALDAAIGAR
jgi:C-terminal processing protease CtpA/Prc